MKEFILMAGAISDKGDIREVNQDNILIKIGEDENNDFGMFIVCDGLGGLSSGEVASKMAIISFKQWWEGELIYLLKQNLEEDLQYILTDLIMVINKNIIKYGLSIGNKVGTTLSVLFIYKDKYYIAHVGDSRIYSITNEITQLTEDHSYVAYKVKNNMMTLKEAKESNERNVLMQCVGVKNELDVFSVRDKLKENEIFIICSDGFYNKLESKDILANINYHEDLDNEILQTAAEELVRIVRNRGETDNVSVILVGVKNKI